VSKFKRSKPLDCAELVVGEHEKGGWQLASRGGMAGFSGGTEEGIDTAEARSTRQSDSDGPRRTGGPVACRPSAHWAPASGPSAYVYGAATPTAPACCEPPFSAAIMYIGACVNSNTVGLYSVPDQTAAGGALAMAERGSGFEQEAIAHCIACGERERVLANKLAGRVVLLAVVSACVLAPINPHFHSPLGHVQWCLMWRLLRCLRGLFAKKY
jgi:hypothetical protein